MPQQQSAATYDPLNPTPYQAPQLPPVQAPPPSPLPPPDQARDFGGTAPSKSGEIAFVLDNAMRGVMQGRAIAKQNQALALDKATQNSQALYNMAAQNLMGQADKLFQDGKLTPEQVQALIKNPNQVPQGMDQSVYGQLHNAASVVNQAWANIQKLYGSQIEPQGKKGSKGKQNQQQDLVQMSLSKDPQEKLQGLYGLWSKLPPPIYGSLYQASQNAQIRARALGATETQIAGTQQSDANRLALDQARAELASMDDGTWKPPAGSSISAEERKQQLLAKVNDLSFAGTLKPGDEAKLLKDQATEAVVNGTATPEQRRLALGASGTSKGFKLLGSETNPYGVQNLDTGEQFLPDASGKIANGPPEASQIWDTVQAGITKRNTEQDARQQAVWDRMLHSEEFQAQMMAQREAIHDKEQALEESSKIPSTEANRYTQAQIIEEQTEKLRDLLNDPDIQKYMGPIAGRTYGATAALYSGKVREMFAAQKSLSALLPILHGYRGGVQTQEAFDSMMGNMHVDVDAYKGALDSIDLTAKSIMDEVKADYPNAPMFRGKTEQSNQNSSGISGQKISLSGAMGKYPKASRADLIARIRAQGGIPVDDKGNEVK